MDTLILKYGCQKWFFTCLSGKLKPWLFSSEKIILYIFLELPLPQSGSLKEPRLSFYQERKLEAQGQKLHWAVEKTRERSPKCKTKWIWEELLPPKRSSSLVALGLPRMLQLPLLTMKLLLWGIHIQTTKWSQMIWGHLVVCKSTLSSRTHEGAYTATGASLGLSAAWITDKRQVTKQY